MNIKSVCVIGMGFIGTTLAAVLAEAGFEVFGIEKDEAKLNQLKQGTPGFYEKGLPELLKSQLGKNLHLFDKIPTDRKIDAFIIAVATPVDKETKTPNLDYVKRAIIDIGPHITENQLFVLRSTVPIGASRTVVLPLLRLLHKESQAVNLSFCPERTAEGKALSELKSLPQIIGALNQPAMDLSVELFAKVNPSVVKTSSLEAAETVKLINNSYRDFNFAYANQIALICKGLDLDADEIIHAANFEYARSNIANPGFVGGDKAGFVGGVCLEKDPHILINSSNINANLIKAARDLNESLIVHVFESVKKYLEDENIAFNKVNVFISGFAFKGHPETDDMRGSPAIELMNLLKGSGIINIYGHDYVVKKEEIEKLGIDFCSVQEGLNRIDVAVFMNNHHSYQDLPIEDLASKMRKGAMIFDGWQLFKEKLKNIDNINYESIGFRKPKNKQA